MTKNPGSCDDVTNKANRADAITMVGNKNYGPVSVTIKGTNVAEQLITFIAKDPTGRPATYKARWGNLDDMWAPCPSSLPSSAKPGVPGPLPAVGAFGQLYMSDLYLAANNAVPDGTPKWPKAQATPTNYYEPLEIRPTSVVVSGIELKNGKFFGGTIDLMDPNLAAPGQTITEGTDTVLQLSKQAFAIFGVKFDALAKLDEAVNVITAQDDPEAIAAAWQIVAACVAQLPVDHAHLSDHQRKQLRRVLPHLFS